MLELSLSARMQMQLDNKKIDYFALKDSQFGYLVNTQIFFKIEI